MNTNTYTTNLSLKLNMNKAWIIFFTCWFTLFACQNKQPPSNSKIPVNLYRAKTQSVLYYDEYPSTTAALNQVNLFPQITGAVTGIFFKEGSMVKRGQKLYEIDTRIYQANYDAAIANLKVSQGNLAQAQQDADRYEYLNQNNAIAKQLYDHAIIALQNAKSQVKAAEETVMTAKTNLNYAIVTAPFDGTIGFSQVKIGNVVTPGSTILNTISTDDPMAVDFVINEKLLPRFKQLKEIQHPAPDSLFTILLPNNAIYPYTGKISIIDRAVDPQTGSIRVRLIFPNPKNYLRAGMSCVVRVHNEELTPQLVLPSKAIVEQMGEYFVYVAKDSTTYSPNQNKKESELIAIQKKVQLGQTMGPNVIIKNGIEVGEQVVVDGIQSLHNGSAITTANVVAPGQGIKNGH